MKVKNSKLKTQNSKSTGVLLINLGGPDSPESVRPFLFNLFSDREIIQLPLQKLFALLISSVRSKKTISHYQEIGGKSPILELTQKQADLLEKKLNNPPLNSPLTKGGHGGIKEGQGGLFKVYIGMRYWHPFIEEAVQKIIKDGINQIIVLPLYPQYSKATTGSSLNELKRILIKYNKNFNLKIIDNWFDNPLYLDAIVEKTKEGLEKFPLDRRKNVQIIFSAHSLPKRFIEEGDPYLDQLNLTIDGIIERMPDIKWRLSFQSKSGPVEWLEPSTDSVIRKLASEGVKEILIVPISFVSDHIETLYEIDIEYAELAKSLGVELFKRTPSLNDSESFIMALADIVKQSMLSD
ncbi:MAG: ferrochelatase [Actinobacteria bacterium]|nr:ferrochelatase [Actinomycetota bacterium]